MGGADLAVLAITALVGLIIGALLPWASRLLGTGHTPRAAREGGPRGPVAARAAQQAPEPGARLAALGALLAVAAAVLAALLVAPGGLEWASELVEGPGGPLAVASGVLVLAVAFSLPVWLGVSR